MRRVVIGLVMALACCAMAPVAAAAEDATRFCNASHGLAGSLPDFSAPDPREDRTYARSLALTYDLAAKYASAGIATDAHALASYFRQLSRAPSTKRAVKIANRRYDEVSAREHRFADHVEQLCILSQLPESTSPEGPFVEYSVGGEGRAAVTYTDASGTVIEGDVALPWYVELPVMPGQPVRVSAVQRGDGVVWCEIHYFTGDDRVDIASDAQAGDGVTATCEGTT